MLFKLTNQGVLNSNANWQSIVAMASCVQCVINKKTELTSATRSTQLSQHRARPHGTSAKPSPGATRHLTAVGSRCCSCRWRWFWRLWRCRWWRLITFHPRRCCCCCLQLVTMPLREHPWYGVAHFRQELHATVSSVVVSRYIHLDLSFVVMHITLSLVFHSRVFSTPVARTCRRIGIRQQSLLDWRAATAGTG